VNCFSWHGWVPSKSDVLRQWDHVVCTIEGLGL